MNSEPETRGINTMQEKSLHAALKRWYARPNDRLEVEIDGYVIDLVQDDRLIEIQTGNFAAIRNKLNALLPDYPVHVVYPIAQDRWIVRIGKDGRRLSRRKSPKHGTVLHAFQQLVYIPHQLAHPNLSLEILLVQDEETRLQDGKGSWRRRGWSIHDRRLLAVLASRVFTGPLDFLALLPSTLPEPFTTADLAKRTGLSRALAQKMAYCLKHMHIIDPVDKRGNAIVYRINDDAG
jgi:hypothetical protein